MNVDWSVSQYPRRNTHGSYARQRLQCCELEQLPTPLRLHPALSGK